MPVEFSYAQARAQSRHGDRLSADTWRSLEASGGLSHYLHSVRATRLAARVQHFIAASSPHAIDRSLRQEWRTEVRNASRWVPNAWRASVTWTAWLADLSAMGYLLNDGDVLPWMVNDPVLAAFALDNRDARRLAVDASELGLLADVAPNADLPGAWLRHWQSLWPAIDVDRAGLAELMTLLRKHWQVTHEDVSVTTARQDHRERLESRVARLLRKRARQPAAIFCHLLLTGLELQRLREGLMRRALFNDVAADARA